MLDEDLGQRPKLEVDPAVDVGEINDRVRLNTLYELLLELRADPSSQEQLVAPVIVDPSADADAIELAGETDDISDVEGPDFGVDPIEPTPEAEGEVTPVLDDTGPSLSSIERASEPGPVEPPVIYNDEQVIGYAAELGPQEMAQALYEELAGRIAPYEELRKETLKFNELAREASEISTRDREYIGVRLDADHIVEARTFEAFKEEFKILGIESSDQMPAMAVPTETHIRKGDSLIDKFEMTDDSLAGLPSWTQVKTATIGRNDLGEIYGTLTNLVESYMELYAKTPVGDVVNPYLKGWLERLSGR